MTGFFLKKSFFDGFDNLAKLVIFNFLYSVLIVSFAIIAFNFLSGNIIFLLLALAIFCFFMSYIYLFSNYFFYKWSCFEQGKMGDALKVVNGKLKYVLPYSILILFGFCLIPYAQYLYITSDNIIGALIAFLLLGFDIIIFLIIQMYMPICYYSDFDGKSVIRRCVFYSFDNFGYALVLLLRSLFDIVFSIFSLTAIPGIGGICISRMVMVRLLAERYQYIEQNPDTSKQNADWTTILSYDIQSTGKRSLKSLFFPWKD